MLGSEPSWKGRNEQITFLKMKLAEAQAQLQQDCSFDGTTRSASTMMSSATREDKRLKAEQRKAEAERRAAADKLAEEHAAAKQEIGQLRQKGDALKARVQSLTQDVKDGRERVEAAQARARQDEHTIQSLNQQLQQSRAERQATRATDASLGDAKQALEQLCATQHEAIATLQRQVEDLDRQRRAARKQHERELEQATQDLNAHRIQMGEEQHILQMQLQQQQQQQARLQTQLAMQGAVVLPPIKPPSRPASKAGSAHASRASSASRATNDAPGTGTATHRACELRLAEATAQLRAADAERAKQTELVALLKRQLDEMQQQREALDGDLRAAKHTLLRLEKDAAAVGKAPDGPARARHELESRLAIQEDEARAIKDAARAALRRKDDEIAVLSSMLGEIKRIFADSVRVMRQTAGPEPPLARRFVN